MNITNFSETNFNLLDIENQNMNSSLELFDIVKQNAEEYFSYISKYKECTASYFDKLSKLTYNIKNDNIITNKNINISSMFSNLNSIPELVKIQVDDLKKFIDSLDLTIKHLENVIKNEINCVEKPHNIFEENKKQYQKNLVKHKKLMDNLSLTEKKIINYYLSKNKQKNYIEEKNNMIASLRDTKFLEKDFLENIKGEENYHWLFQESSLKNIDEIKSHIRIILENLNSCIVFFLCMFNDCYFPCVNLAQNKTQNIKSQNVNTKALINESLLLKTYKLEELPSDKYIVKIFNNPGIKKLTYSIQISNKETPIFMNFGNFLNFFKENDDDISEDDMYNLNKIDLLGVAKKLYHNFKMISKNNYDIKSEEEKIKVKNYSDKLLLMKKYKNSSKIAEKMTHEEKKNLLELIKKKDNAEIFLTRLNKIRCFGTFEYPKKNFDDILKIFSIILEQLIINKDPFLFKFTIILSQTFYYMENGEKKYIYHYIKNHKVFHNEENWRNLLNSNIKQKVDNFNEMQYTIQNSKKNEQKKKR